MGIAFTKYVSITSTVQGAGAVKTRELIGRIFTTNPLVPTGTLIEFTTAADVGNYFGTTSEEYLRALFYFGWISKNNTRPRKLGFSFWASAATAPKIYGAKNTYTLAMFTGINAGGMTITLGGVAGVLAAIDFSGAGTLAAVAAIMQTKIRAAGGTPLWTAATVAYDATNNRFVFTGGATGACTVAVTDGAQGVAAALGWTSASAIKSDGVAAQTLTAMLDASASGSNNFGSFVFTDAAALNLVQVQEVAAWNEGQNVDYQYCVAVSSANAAAWSAALIAVAGVELVLAGPTGEYHGMMPMVILAATDYTKRNSVQNYMFQLFPTLTPTVNDTATSDTMDNLRVNYLGATQVAGASLAFYQRGVIMGSSSAPVDANVYANEQWLKDAAASAIMNLLVTAARVPVNDKGRAQVTGVLMAVIDNNSAGQVGAVQNGTISVGKPLTQSQITFITEETDDPNAWRQVQTIGYWLNVGFDSYQTADNRTEWEALYTLIYSKDDAIRKVEGSHDLI
jgi:hypothetical protein